MLKLSRFEGSIPLSPLLESMEPVLEPAGYVATLFSPFYLLLLRQLGFSFFTQKQFLSLMAS